MVVARSWLVVAAIASACGRIDFDPRLATLDGSDGGLAADAMPACTMFGPWGTPRVIGELATARDEFGGQIMSDNLTLYFDRHGGGDEIYVARRPDRSSPFGPAQQLPELGTNSFEGSASATADELELYFESSRSGKACIYRATRATATAMWDPPAQVAALCTSPNNGAYVTPDGLTLFYNSASAADPEGVIMVTTRASRTVPFPTGTPAGGGLAGGATKGYCNLASDGLTLYFETGSPTDLYQVARSGPGSPWGTPSQIPGMNTATIEQDVSITTDGLELFFASNRVGSMGLDLYVASRACLAF